MAIAPGGLEGIPADELKIAQGEARWTVAHLRAFDAAENIGLTAASGAGATTAQFFQWDETFPVIAPHDRQVPANHLDTAGLERPLGHRKNLATMSAGRDKIKPMVRHLYLHVPFCARICPYCAFYVHRGGPEAQVRFVAALRQEWRSAREEFTFELETIYLGGGTPSILSAELFSTLAQEGQADAKEFTLEVNPATVTPEKARAWRAAGVNRISLGAQSFHPEHLKLLGRQHAPEDIAVTCELLRAHGLTNINVDLIFALPGQTEKDWRDTLAQALACQPTHLSAYALTYEEDTPFFEKLRAGLWRQNEEREIAMFEETREMLSQDGFVDYEISNFARPGFESQHNLAYWRGADYVGLGPSACSTVGTWRWKNVPDTTAYEDRLARGVSLREEREEITTATRTRERIMFGLRMREGVARGEFRGAEAALKDVQQQGLAIQERDRVCLTPKGKLVADSVAAMFV